MCCGLLMLIALVSPYQSQAVSSPKAREHAPERLSSSEAGFLERRIGDVQVLFAKPHWR